MLVKNNLFSKQTIPIIVSVFCTIIYVQFDFLSTVLIVNSLLWKIESHFQRKELHYETSQSKFETRGSNECSRELTLNIFHKGDYSLRQHLFLRVLCLSCKNICNFRCGCNDEISRRCKREHLWHSSISPEHKTNSLNLRKSIFSSLTRFDSLGENC